MLCFGLRQWSLDFQNLFAQIAPNRKVGSFRVIGEHAKSIFSFDSERQGEKVSWKRKEENIREGTDRKAKVMQRSKGLAILKVTKCGDFNLFFYTNKSYGQATWGLEKIFILKTVAADICHFVIWMHATCALKNCLRKLSMR
jgi:hypothetical protein